MKRLSHSSLNNKNRIIVICAAITTFFVTHSAYADLKNAKDALEKLQDDLIKNIIPIAAAVILLCLAIGYAGRYLEKDTFIRWAIGVVIAGSATQIAAMLFKP
ncbi:type IV secretory pathway VirB2 component (pilin) [Bartonella silvatica]|uniref:Type IV secretory pathway VirB2 component (Pilin) n=1 Tax=Bartonella silvatica TaxID=357760 RepID=A0ABV2HG71_9HYPH